MKIYIYLTLRLSVSKIGKILFLFWLLPRSVLKIFFSYFDCCLCLLWRLTHILNHYYYLFNAISLYVTFLKFWIHKNSVHKLKFSTYIYDFSNDHMVYYVTCALIKEHYSFTEIILCNIKLFL